MSAHTEGGAGRCPRRGDLVEFLSGGGARWFAARVDAVEALKPKGWAVYARAVDDHEGDDLLCRGPGGWRWPEAGAVRVRGEGLPVEIVDGRCTRCGLPLPEGPAGHDGFACNGFRSVVGGRLAPVGEVLPDPVIGELPPGESAPWRRAIEVTGAALADAPAAFAAAAGEVVSEVAPCGARAGRLVCDLPSGHEGAHRAAEGEVPPAEPLAGPPCACGSIAFEVRSGMLPGRIACMACGAERWKAPPDRVVSEGGEGRVTWKLSARRGMFAGEVRVSGELAASFAAASSEEVTRKMLAYVDGVLDPRDTRVPYESPAITSKLVEVQALMGLHRLSEAIEKRIEDQRHAQLRARGRIIDEALAWWEGYQRAWSEAPALKDADAATVQACRALCDRLVTSLFAQIGGVL